MAHPLDQDLYRQNPDELPPLVIAYNCGRPWKGDKPDMSFVGTGEGAGVLGAGVYFATDEDVADNYLKFGGAKHKVTIDTRGLLDVRGTTQESQAANAALREVLEDAIVEKNAERRVRRTDAGTIWHISGHSPLQHGKGYAGYIFMLLGPDEGRRRIIESGVTGMYEKLPDGYEIAVYDPSIVTLIERTVPGHQRNPDEDDDDDDEEAEDARGAPGGYRPIFAVKTNFPDADLWIVRKGTPEKIGSVTETFSPAHIGVQVLATDLVLPDYLYYVLKNIHARGFYRERMTGTLRLQHITTDDVKDALRLLRL